MTRSTTDQTANDALKEVWQLLSANPFLAPQVEHFWDAQDYLLSETEAFTAKWFARRHAATRSAIDAARNLAKNSSAGPETSMNTISEWQSQSASRVAEDVQEWLDLWSRCADYVARSEGQAGAEGIEKVVKATASKRRPKDDLPV